MISKTVLKCILCIVFANILNAQQQKDLYDWNRIFVDNYNVYSYGTRYVNKSLHNRSADGYEHDRDFYLIRYDFTGKKLSETLIDKNRDFISSSQVVKKRHSLYTLLAVINRNPDLHSSYYNHFLIRFDTLGNIVHEFKIQDSSYAQFNSIFYESEFIYVTFVGKEIISEKYDYNFKLVEKITNPLINSFLYGGKVYQSKSGVVCFGQFNNINELNKKAEKRWLNNLFFDGSNFCVKKINGKIDNTSKVEITPLPLNDIFIDSFQDGDKFFCTTYNKNYTKTRNEKLFFYDLKKNKLELLTDTISSYSKLICVKALSEKEFILFGYGNAIGGKSEIHWCPDIIYYIKEGRLKSYFKMESKKSDFYSQAFTILNKKLYIYQMNNSGEDLKIKIYDYEAGRLVNDL